MVMVGESARENPREPGAVRVQQPYVGCQKLLLKVGIRLLAAVKPIKRQVWGFLGGAVIENLPASAGDTGSSPGLGRSHMPWSD